MRFTTIDRRALVALVAGVVAGAAGAEVSHGPSVNAAPLEPGPQPAVVEWYGLEGVQVGLQVGPAGEQGYPSVSPADVAVAKRRHLAHRVASVKKDEDPKTVAVDCAKGHSVQDAIDQGADVVEIDGICHENVRIEGRPVTLRGSDPGLDGIRGVVEDPQPLAAVEIAYSDGTVIEDLSVANSPGIGVGMWFSHVVMRRCAVEANAAAGLHVSSASALTAEELTISNNGGVGLRVQRSSSAFVFASDVSGNGAFAAASVLGGILSLLDTTVSGPRGLQAAFDSYADVDCVNGGTGHPCSLSVTDRAAQAISGGTVALLGTGDFSGWLLSFDRGAVQLVAARQVDTGVPARPNLILRFSELSVEPFEVGGVHVESRLRGDTELQEFSRAVLVGASELDGTLECSSASDAWADPAVVLTPGSAIVGCEHAPPPGP